MNPRLFCREQGFHKALLLTYSFDPVFFEQIVLPDLWAGASSDVLVLGDAGQVDSAMAPNIGQLWHLGKRYMLARIATGGAFHPKMILRLGPKNGALLIGSGNVTSSGWGGNQELAAAWMIGPEQIDTGAWLHSFFDSVVGWCQGELEVQALNRMRDIPWLATTMRDAAATPIFHSSGETTLASTLAARWAGRRFDKVHILTGSTDESGAFLRWAYRTFGITQALVAVTPTHASFQAEQLSDLPIDLRLIPITDDRPLHAKFYWFDGKDGAGAVMGSANCSAAAWLQAPANGGNVEAVVVFDRPKAELFENVLRIFSAPAFLPVELLQPSGEVEPVSTPNLPRFALSGLQWDEATSRFLAWVRPDPGANAKVHLLVLDQELPMVHSGSPTAAFWSCDIPVALEFAGALFAAVRVTDADGVHETSIRWVDHVAELAHASNATRLVEPIKGLARVGSTGDQRRMLDELQQVAQMLFSEPGSFQDPAGSGRTEDRAQSKSEQAAPVDPAMLIRHLDDVPTASAAIAGEARVSFSLAGIMRLLFDSEGDTHDPAKESADDQKLDEGQDPNKIDEPKPQPTKDIEGDAERLTRADIDPRMRARLEEQIDEFLSQLSKPEFAQHCTATQLVQAVSFPLAVTVLGQTSGWVNCGKAEEWMLKLFALLFRGTKASDPGLLGKVEQRYTEAGSQETLQHVLGDGTLWLVLISALGQSTWSGLGAFWDKALDMRRVYRSQALLANAQATRVGLLIRKLKIDDARKYVSEVAPVVTASLDELETRLGRIWETEMQDQTDRRITHQAGDLLWRPSAGWAICLENAKADRNGSMAVRLRSQPTRICSAGYYVNVTQLAATNVALAELMSKVHAQINETE